MELEKRLRLLRNQRGISQTKLADMLNRSPGSISNYENGAHFPDLQTLIDIADFYGVSVDYLLGHSQLNAEMVSLDQTVFGTYTVGDLLWMQDHMSDKSQEMLVYVLQLIEMAIHSKSPLR